MIRANGSPSSKPLRRNQALKRRKALIDRITLVT